MACWGFGKGKSPTVLAATDTEAISLQTWGLQYIHREDGVSFPAAGGTLSRHSEPVLLLLLAVFSSCFYICPVAQADESFL